MVVIEFFSAEFFYYIDLQVRCLERFAGHTCVELVQILVEIEYCMARLGRGSDRIVFGCDFCARKEKKRNKFDWIPFQIARNLLVAVFAGQT